MRELVVNLELLGFFLYLLSFLLLRRHQLLSPLNFYLGMIKKIRFNYTSNDIIVLVIVIDANKPLLIEGEVSIPACSCEQYLEGSQALESPSSRSRFHPEDIFKSQIFLRTVFCVQIVLKR